jgi:hypothetical protein
MMADEARRRYEDVVEELTATSPATSGKMFGMPTLKNGGKAFAGLTEDAMVFKLGMAERAEALGLAGARLFDPMGGRPMKEWVVVPAAHASKWLELARAAMRYVSSAG